MLQPHEHAILKTKIVNKVNDAATSAVVLQSIHAQLYPQSTHNQLANRKTIVRKLKEVKPTTAEIENLLCRTEFSGPDADLSKADIGDIIGRIIRKIEARDVSAYTLQSISEWFEWLGTREDDDDPSNVYTPDGGQMTLGELRRHKASLPETQDKEAVNDTKTQMSIGNVIHKIKQRIEDLGCQKLREVYKICFDRGLRRVDAEGYEEVKTPDEAVAERQLEVAEKLYLDAIARTVLPASAVGQSWNRHGNVTSRQVSSLKGDRSILGKFVVNFYAGTTKIRNANYSTILTPKEET